MQANPSLRAAHVGARGAGRRPGLGPRVVAILAAGVLVAYLLLWTRLGHEQLAGSDFSASYVAAQTWRAGDSTHLYDQAAETARHQALLPGFRIDLPFITPPTTALLAAPLTAFDVDTATRLAGLIELLSIAGAVVVALRAATSRRGSELAVLGLAALAAPGTCIVLWQAQWDGLCALGLALAYVALRRGHPAIAGLAIALGFLPVKPHLALGIAVFLLAAAGARALAGLTAGAVLTLAAGLAVGGAAGWRDWLGALSLSSGHSPLASLLGYTGLAGSWLGDTTAARAIAFTASAPALAACVLLGLAVRRRPALLEPALAGAAALSLAAAPHLLAHDLAVLAPAAAWALAWAGRTGDAGRTLRLIGSMWALISAAALLDLGNASSAPPGRLVPWALTLAGAIALAAAYSGSGRGVGGVVDQS